MLSLLDNVRAVPHAEVLQHVEDLAAEADLGVHPVLLDGDGGEEHITYLFCIHDNQPIALVDQTTNGNAIKVKETANQDVRKGFAKIAISSDDD